ncbi:MAG: PilN domain-containing protein [Oceanococcaceae bacterium]
MSRTTPPAMLRVNLLDWRSRRREERKKLFGMIMGGAGAAGILVCVLLIQIVGGKLENQETRNRMLQAEIKAMDAQIKEIKDLEQVRQNLIARTQVIEKLQQSRAQTVHFFDELVRTVPEGLYLTRVEQRGDNTQIDGLAESNGRVSTYIRNLESAEWLHEPRLVFIRAANQGNRRLSEFSLRVRVGPAKKTTGEEELIE